jgi:hypothetical protein
MNYRDAENPNIESQPGIVKLLVRYHIVCAKKIHSQTHTHIMTFRRRGAVYDNTTRVEQRKKDMKRGKTKLWRFEIGC